MAGQTTGEPHPCSHRTTHRVQLACRAVQNTPGLRWPEKAQCRAHNALSVCSATHTHTHTHTHTRSTRQTGHWSRQPECTRSRQVQCQNKSMFKHGTRRLSAVPRTDRQAGHPSHFPVQPLAALLNQRPASKDRMHVLRSLAQISGKLRTSLPYPPHCLSSRTQTHT